jgi:hypothetical protein
VVILELIHASSSDLTERAHLLDQTNRASVRNLVTLNNLADRTVSYRRQIFQVSALSTFDGSLYAYHGFNG